MGERRMLKTIVVYVHLLATCMALGSVLLTDFRLWTWRNRKPDAVMLAQLVETQHIVTFALAALWVTGALLIGLGFWHEGAHYLLNQKLWAKVSVVSLLTLNGILLHRIGFPLLQKAALAAQPRAKLMCLGLLGALSSTGWLFAAFLGVARPWNYVLPYHQVMTIFACVLLIAALTAIAATYNLKAISRAAI